MPRIRISNILIGFANTVTILISITLITASIYIPAHGGNTACQRVLQKPLVYTGLALFALSVIGIIGACCKARWAMCVYALLMLVLMLGLIGFTLFALLVTNKGVGKVVSGRGYKEYRLGDYSNWLRKYVVNRDNWVGIRSCLVDAKVCSKLDVHDVIVASEFYQMHLSPIQSGCCKPPTYCEFTYKNATFWEVPKSGPSVLDSDCMAWSNDQTKLCYDCKSCKGGVLANIKKEWKHLVAVNIFLIVFIFVMYAIGCCAYHNNQSSHHDKYMQYRSHP